MTDSFSHPKLYITDFRIELAGTLATHNTLSDQLILFQLQLVLPQETTPYAGPQRVPNM